MKLSKFNLQLLLIVIINSFQIYTKSLIFIYLFKLKLFRKPLKMDLGIIEKLAKCIVRPPKASYNIEDLGIKYFI